MGEARVDRQSARTTVAQLRLMPTLLSALHRRGDPKTHFVSELKRITASRPTAKKNLLSFFQKLWFHPCVPPHKRGVSRPSRTLRWDAVGASGCSMVFHADEQLGAHGEVVWSWRPGAGAQRNARARCRDTGARKPVPGESAK
jgi:hypothetical protein